MSLSHISVIMADSILRLTDLKKDVPCEIQNDEVGKRRESGHEFNLFPTKNQACNWYPS